MPTHTRTASSWRWPSRWAWAQAVVALLVTAALAGLWLVQFQAGPLARLEGRVQDAQMQWRGPLAPGTTYPVLLVRFDEASAARFGGAAPSRAQLTALIDRMQAAKPRLIAIDLPLFDTQPDADPALAAALRGGVPVLLPFTLHGPAGAGSGGASGVAAIPPALRAQAFPRAEGAARSALVPDHAEAPPEPLLSAAQALGQATLHRDPDGTPRHDLPALPLGGEAYPSLALRIAGDAMRQPWSEATLRWSRDVRWGSLRVPLDLLSRQGINYYGPAGTFPAVSVADLVDGRVPDDLLHNRIVILGVTAQAGGEPLPSPFDADLPGVERLATVVDNILTGRSLSRPGWASLAELIALLTLPLLCCVLLARGRLWLGLLLLALLTAAGLAAAQWAFEEERLVLPLAYPLLAIALASACALALRGLARQARRRAELRRLRASEARYTLAAQGTHDGLWDWDVARDRLHVSPRWRVLMGQDGGPLPDGSAARDTPAMPLTALADERGDAGIERFTASLDATAAALFRSDLEAHLQGRTQRFHHVLRFEQGGQPRALLVRGMALRRDGKAERMAGSLTDLSEQDALQAQLTHDSLHDRVTGLPNRTLFLELLAQRLAAPVPGVPIAVVLLGLDDFHDFTERHGPLAGNAVLAECARRLGRRTGRVVARLGPDLFAVLFEVRVEGGTLIDRVPEWALARIEEPFVLDAFDGGEGRGEDVAEPVTARAVTGLRATAAAATAAAAESTRTAAAADTTTPRPSVAAPDAAAGPDTGSPEAAALNTAPLETAPSRPPTSLAAARAAARASDVSPNPAARTAVPRSGAHRLSASAGWAHTGQGNFSPKDLLAAAQNALSRAKAAGTGQVRMFDPGLPRVPPPGHWVRDDLTRALAAGELQLHYQPIVRLSDRSVVGFEALIRWPHPTRGLLMPHDFLPIAEDSGQIVDLSRWTLIEAALQLRRWRDVGFKGEIAVNLSAAQLASDDALLDDAREALKALGDVPAAQLKLEVAESAVMAHPGRNVDLLRALARLGFTLALDDVGRGFSSLAHLHRVPSDTLKIDRSVVMRLAAGREAREAVRTIVGLAGTLGQQTLAEGVEDEAEAELLVELGVTLAQGWWFAKALPADEAKRLIPTAPGKKAGPASR